MAQQLIQILSVYASKADVMARICGMPEIEVHMYLDQERKALWDGEDDYYQNHNKNTRKEVLAMRELLPGYERKEMRRKFLQGEITRVKERYLQNPTDKRIEKKLRGLMFEIKIHLGEVKGISAEMIQQAKTYPITELIEHRNLMAICPFHNDKSPSLNLKKNFYYCHGCGEHGDVIDFVMKQKNVSFKQAVEALMHY